MSVNSLSTLGINLLFTLIFLPFFISGIVIIGIILFVLDPKSPVFFVQIRMGYLGTPFWVYKFRTLKNGSPSNKFAGFLRLSGLDEVPQIINILKGEMWFFGPRPKLDSDIPLQYVSRYNRTVLKRHPGLFSLYLAEKGPGQSVLQKQDIAEILIYERYEQAQWSLKLMRIIFFRCFRKISCNCIDFFLATQSI